MKGSWYFESASIAPNWKAGYKIKRKIFSKKTPFQKIDVCQTEEFGNILFLDGLTQIVERDEFIYHEMIVHIPLMSHRKPEKILIIGGGDGGALREVLKHRVKEVHLVEIDQAVIEASKKYLPAISGKSFEDRRVNLHIEDGLNFVKQYDNYFDVIIVDSSDPIGPARKLFSSQSYKNVFKALEESGIAVFQSGLTIIQKKEVKNVYQKSKKIFPIAKIYYVSIPTYLSGDLSFVIGSKKTDPTKTSLKKLTDKYRKLKLETKYYNPKIHFAAFVLPNYMKNILK